MELDTRRGEPAVLTLKTVTELSSIEIDVGKNDLVAREVVIDRAV